MATQRERSSCARRIISGLALVGSALCALSSLELVDPQWSRSLLNDGNDGNKSKTVGKNNKPPPTRSNLKLLPGGGRLGDQLFMYASLLRLAHQHKLKPCVTKAFRRIPIQKMFAGPYEWCDDDEYDVAWEGGWQAERVAKLRRREGDSGIVYGLSGYMHSPSNFVNYSPGLIFDALTLKEDSDAYRRAQKVLTPFDDPSIVKVGLHIRRGDKVKNKQYQTAGVDYFERAMEYIRAKYNDPGRQVHFLVTSDSMPWVQKRRHVFGAGDVSLVEHSFDPADPYDAFDSSTTDLAVLMQCDHIILSGGGFGFWGAFLGAHRRGGEIIVGESQEKTMNSMETWTNIDDSTTKRDDAAPSDDTGFAAVVDL